MKSHWTQLTLIAAVVFCLSVTVVIVTGRANPERKPITFEAVIPNTKEAFPSPLARTGEQDITFRVSAEEAGNLQGLAERRNVRFKVTVE